MTVIVHDSDPASARRRADPEAELSARPPAPRRYSRAEKAEDAAWLLAMGESPHHIAHRLNLKDIDNLRHVVTKAGRRDLLKLIKEKA